MVMVGLGVAEHAPQPGHYLLHRPVVHLAQRVQVGAGRVGHHHGQVHRVVEA